jgi:hypothetical protein
MQFVRSPSRWKNLTRRLKKGARGLPFLLWFFSLWLNVILAYSISKVSLQVNGFGGAESVCAKEMYQF